MVSIIERLQKELTPLLLDKGFNIKNIHYYKGSNTKKGKLSLTIININNQPVTIQDCSIISKEASIIIDVNEIISEAYILEVSSPGCENVLFFYNDFIANIGKSIKVELKQQSNTEFLATILKVSNNKVTLQKHLDKTNITLPINNIKKATLI